MLRPLPALPERLRASLGRRGAAVVLALAIEALIVVLFLYLTPRIPAKKPPDPMVFGFDADAGEAVQPKTPEKSDTRRNGGRKAPDPLKAIREPVTPPVVPEAPPAKSNVIWLTRREYSARDIGSARRADAPSPSAASEGGSSRPDSELAEGRGPNGEPLYAAEWQTRPTHAQLSTYIPARARQSGWGLIACRTVANYRVEDCRELGQSPGSGLAGAVRQAAWQFRVRPPRIGGKYQVGAWVSIRIDYTITER
jgi:protein TonB